MSPMWLLILVPIAYLAGSIPFGLLVGLSKGIDPRTGGSGNIGATNVARVLGHKKYFWIVFFLDLSKSLIPMAIASALALRIPPEQRDWHIYLLWLSVGFAAVMGHMFSIFLGFKGGKGVATSAGVMLGLFPYYTWPGLIAIAIFVVIFMIWRYISLGSIIGASAFPIAYLIIGLSRGWPVFASQLPLLIFGVLMAGLIVYKHRSNIARLRAGTESRFGASPPAPANPATPSRAAFTLVELLVVIGIIAILLGILLPVIGRAQESSRRVNCLSNIRQVYTAVVFYAHANRDQVPLGYRAGRKQFNSMIWSSTSNYYVLFGLLYRGGHMKTPRVFFCPSENNPQSMFATPTNPWPPGSDGTPAINGWCGYGCRPDVDIPDDMAALPPTFFFPRLYRFRNLAILADLTATPERVTTRHNRGINVLYGHGGARWVERGAFDDQLKLCPTINVTANPYQDEIWKRLDTQ